MHPSYARDRPTSRPALYEFTLVNNGCGREGSILDAEMPERVIGPAQTDCGGLAWTRTFS